MYENGRGGGIRTVGRRFLTLGTVLVLAATLLGGVVARPAHAAATCHPYPDVTSANPHCENIAWLKSTGITKPADGLYHPAGRVTRGQMTAFLFRLSNPDTQQPACPRAPFPDVSTASTFCGYIGWARDTGLAYGYADGTFGPGKAVTRGAMAAFLHRIARPGEAAASCTSRPFTDVPITDPFCRVIRWAKSAGITYGIGHGEYGTRAPVTRQAMASFLHRLSAVGTTDQVPTRVRGVTPFRPDGRVRLAASDYRLPGGTDCSPSPYSRAASVYRCGNDPDRAVTCWPAPVAMAGTAVWCLRAPGDSRVVQGWDALLPGAPATSDADPWLIVLDDGSRCGPATGDGWPAPADGFSYTYGCEGPTGGLVAPDHGSTVTRATSHFRAYRTVSISDGAPVSTMGVRELVFAGAAPRVAAAKTGNRCAALSEFPATVPGGWHRASRIACVGSWASVRYDSTDGGYRDVAFHRSTDAWTQVSTTAACTTPGPLPAALYFSALCFGN